MQIMNFFGKITKNHKHSQKEFQIIDKMQISLKLSTIIFNVYTKHYRKLYLFFFTLFKKFYLHIFP